MSPCRLELVDAEDVEELARGVPFDLLPGSLVDVGQEGE